MDYVDFYSANYDLQPKIHSPYSCELYIFAVFRLISQ